jgi:hypothetical protein
MKERQGYWINLPGVTAMEQRSDPCFFRLSSEVGKDQWKPQWSETVYPTVEEAYKGCIQELLNEHFRDQERFEQIKNLASKLSAKS